MDWADAAVLSTAIMAVVNVLDSHLVARRMPSLRAFLIPAGILSIINSAILLSLFPLPQDLSVVPFLITVLSSALRALAVLLILHILQTGEVSRVIPVVHTNPVFVAILAVLLLGETLTYLEWIAVMVVVLGAVLISIRRGSRGSGAGFAGSLFLPLVASLLLATANLTSKYALEHVSYWNMLAFGSLLVAFIFLSVSLCPLPLRQLRTVRRPVLTAGLLILNNALVLLGMFLMFWAIQRGPVSLVSAIAGARPAFVFVYAVILGRISHVLLEQRMGRQTIALRLGAIAMIVGGITIIHLA
ncbi:DMT family transporter [Dehalococcoidia bacterium]|nr:DMT family transporter [Dehalococcoidia bacterium]